MADKNSLEKQLGQNSDNSSNRGFTSAMDDGKGSWSRRMYESELRRRKISTNSAETAPTSTSQNEDIGTSPKEKPKSLSGNSIETSGKQAKQDTASKESKNKMTRIEIPSDLEKTINSHKDDFHKKWSEFMSSIKKIDRSRSYLQKTDALTQALQSYYEDISGHSHYEKLYRSALNNLKSSIDICKGIMIQNDKNSNEWKDVAQKLYKTQKKLDKLFNTKTILEGIVSGGKQNEGIRISSEVGKEHITSYGNNPETWARLPTGELDPFLSDLDPRAPETSEEFCYWRDKGNVLPDWRRELGFEYQQVTPLKLRPEQVPLMSITQYNEIHLGDPDIPTGHPMHPNELAKSCKKLVEDAQKEFKETTTQLNVLDNVEEFNKRMENITRLFEGITRLSEIYSTHVANNKAEEVKRVEITKQIVKITGQYPYPESTATFSKWQEMEELSKSIEGEIKKRN